MGSMITLSLGGIDIDWGKNRSWENHHWLFPPGSLTTMDYFYVDDDRNEVVERQPGFETTLGEARFRLCHLGYSAQETEAKFNNAVARWNRTHDLRLSFTDFRRALMCIDFRAFDDGFGADLASFGRWLHGHGVRLDLLNDLPESANTDEAALDGFLDELDLAIILRVFAGLHENLDLPLRWRHHDLIEGGWASLEDLTDIDRQRWIINHTTLLGRLQDHTGAQTVAAFDTWLAGQGLPQTTSYLKVKQDGTLALQTLTLPSAVRNIIHHPENPHNVLTNHDLRESVEALLGVARRLATPIPGLG